METVRSVRGNKGSRLGVRLSIYTELYYISGDCALIPRQSTNCNQKHGGFWPNLRHFDVTVSLFSCRTPLTNYT